MSSIDGLFLGEPQRRLHPCLKAWKGRGLERIAFKRPRDGVFFEPARIFAYGPTSPVDPSFRPEIDSTLWERELHEDLVAEGVRSISPHNESLRFGYALRALFEPIEARYGDGFFSASLLHYLQEAGLAPSRFEALHPYVPGGRLQSGVESDDCREAIEQQLQLVAHDLTDRLRYPIEEAKTILVDALFCYLDDRFSITSRKLLGFG